MTLHIHYYYFVAEHERTGDCCNMYELHEGVNLSSCVYCYHTNFQLYVAHW
jgi:hypothetical protein